MSVKRYHLSGDSSEPMKECADGEYVKYEDYASEKKQADFAVSLLCCDSQLGVFMDKFCKPLPKEDTK